MDNKLQQELYDRYPKIFIQKDLPMTETCMCWGISTGDGWYRILDGVCFLIQQRVNTPFENIKLYEKWLSEETDETKTDRLKEQIEEERKKIISVQFVQVKEKFGTLRIYHNSDDDFVGGVISMAECMSSVTCESCGDKGELVTKGWYHTLCDRCRTTRFSRDLP